ncbi:General transcription factor II-I repeat domain-containing protein 2-like [Oopsacas minuta]|uniref:General transcription factor II-I repeat domain-containing protein 2-like n=1 Tax=Oopsacas minuta TaxID=111878 RepID=A0AAV7KBY1_9METZ|nr:General transcription factor II-I repeat domain-containing protein 2-like [Oopsacas minuta]
MHRRTRGNDIFEVLNDLDSDYGDVIYFTSVRWLCRGAVLKRFSQLPDETHFLASKDQKMPELDDPTWISDFAFLVDMTTLQGKNKMIHELYATIRNFESNLALFKLQLKSNYFFTFQH